MVNYTFIKQNIRHSGTQGHCHFKYKAFKYDHHVIFLPAKSSYLLGNFPERCSPALFLFL